MGFFLGCSSRFATSISPTLIPMNWPALSSIVSSKLWDFGHTNPIPRQILIVTSNQFSKNLLRLEPGCNWRPVKTIHLSLQAYKKRHSKYFLATRHPERSNPKVNILKITKRRISSIPFVLVACPQCYCIAFAGGQSGCFYPKLVFQHKPSWFKGIPSLRHQINGHRPEWH